LFSDNLGLDPHTADIGTLEECARDTLELGALELDRDGWLDLLMSHCIEPAIASRGLLFVHDYPETQAALARCVERDGQRVADRFELYVDGVELANGYRELLDAVELRRRAEDDNRRRAVTGLPRRELDPRLVAALEAGMPDCSGVALGVDRLLMLKLGAKSLSEVLAFDWSRS
jgi:lysyl-tRNA synthetase class 2